jgi:hypothetical protein
MKIGRIGHVAAWSVLALPIPVAALDAFIVLGGFFTMSNAEAAIADNWSWFNAGPFSFLPALVMGILSVVIFRGSTSKTFPTLESVNKWGRNAVWLPILWLSYGACRFTWVNLWGNGFACEMNHALYISLISVPMLIAALCLSESRDWTAAASLLAMKHSHVWLCLDCRQSGSYCQS